MVTERRNQKSRRTLEIGQLISVEFSNDVEVLVIIQGITRKYFFVYTPYPSFHLEKIKKERFLDSFSFKIEHPSSESVKQFLVMEWIIFDKNPDAYQPPLMSEMNVLRREVWDDFAPYAYTPEAVPEPVLDISSINKLMEAIKTTVAVGIIEHEITPIIEANMGEFDNHLTEIRNDIRKNPTSAVREKIAEATKRIIDECSDELMRHLDDYF